MFYSHACQSIHISFSESFCANISVFLAGSCPCWCSQHCRLLLVGEFGVFAAVPLADRLSVSWLRKLSQG